MAKKLRQIREGLGWTQDKAADAMGISPSHYKKLERGERGLTDHTITLAAKAFGVGKSHVIDELIDNMIDAHPLEGSSVIIHGDLHTSTKQSNVLSLRNHLIPIPLAGRVEAGAFREVEDITDLDAEPEYVFDEPDPDFPRAKRFAVTVQGDSMNAAEPPLFDGNRLICVDFDDAGVPLSDGMTVVVQRTRDGGLTREWSVKEVEMGDDQVAFCPRSTNARHKPIVVPINPEPDDAVQVEVIGIARSVQAMIPRYRLKR